jgi:hypothetical protein
VLRWTAEWLAVPITRSRKTTLEARLDHVKGMDCESRDCAGREASNGLDQRWRESRMVLSH